MEMMQRDAHRNALSRHHCRPSLSVLKKLQDFSVVREIFWKLYFNMAYVLWRVFTKKYAKVRLGIASLPVSLLFIVSLLFFFFNIQFYICICIVYWWTSRAVISFNKRCLSVYIFEWYFDARARNWWFPITCRASKRLEASLYDTPPAWPWTLRLSTRNEVWCSACLASFFIILFSMHWPETLATKFLLLNKKKLNIFVSLYYIGKQQ